MKLICDGKDLADAVAKVSKAIAVKATMPILEGIKLVASGKELTIVATDMELAIEKTIVADVLIEGQTVVPGKFFTEFVKKLVDQQIELIMSDQKLLHIKYYGNESTVGCLSASEFPEIKRLENAQSFTIIKQEFKDLINKVVFSVATDDARPILKGVLLEVDDFTLTGVALDGYRLAKTVKAIEKTTAKQSAVVSGRCLIEIEKLIEGDTDPLVVLIQRSYIHIDLGHTKITARLLDGDFINYKQIIPSQYNTTITVPRISLSDTLERACLLAKTERNNLVRLDIKDNFLYISSNSELGNLSEKIVIRVNGVDLPVAFNAKYLLEIARNITSDNIIFNFINSTSPAIITPTGGAEDVLYLVLPVRLLQ